MTAGDGAQPGTAAQGTDRGCAARGSGAVSGSTPDWYQANFHTGRRAAAQIVPPSLLAAGGLGAWAAGRGPGSQRHRRHFQLAHSGSAEYAVPTVADATVAGTYYFTRRTWGTPPAGQPGGAAADVAVTSPGTGPAAWQQAAGPHPPPSYRCTRRRVPALQHAVQPHGRRAVPEPGHSTRVRPTGVRPAPPEVRCRPAVLLPEPNIPRLGRPRRGGALDAATPLASLLERGLDLGAVTGRAKELSGGGGSGGGGGSDSGAGGGSGGGGGGGGSGGGAAAAGGRAASLARVEDDPSYRTRPQDPPGFRRFVTSLGMGFDERGGIIVPPRSPGGRRQGVCEGAAAPQPAVDGPPTRRDRRGTADSYGGGE
ncbi:hypothetical protein Rsub_11634 [Raphidocelis subcapitata]|uniref:Uncharacterized protein n=1 Tax=Raphidocelis subcapitata TaxID=307507 RepID=A0A2V0PHY6_9CHLO|nr:hypothetical protein Rsub_11634 [Raphidocelis subcapitata]|eukprot:GBF99189.1 hypothetical protein Rsub_11634 [Raphidocelis subcapitata]